MTVIQEVERIKFYTRAVRKAWKEKKIYKNPEDHDSKKSVVAVAQMYPCATILIYKWKSLVGIGTGGEQDSNQLFEDIQTAEDFLKLL